MFLFDTIGIAVFTILGIQISMGYQLSPEACLMMGVTSAVFGGVIRDVLTNEIPLIFRKEIYATACFVGGLVYMLTFYINQNDQVNSVVAIIVVFAIRYFSIKKGWSLNFNES